MECLHFPTAAYLPCTLITDAKWRQQQLLGRWWWRRCRLGSHCGGCREAVGEELVVMEVGQVGEVVMVEVRGG